VSQSRMQRWRVAPPKTISVKLLQSVISSLNDFMPGITTVERFVKTDVVADGLTNTISGSDSWKAYQPFSLDKIEHIQFELTLKKDDVNSCQLHVEFRKNHIFLSVSDHGTGWLDAVFEEMERTLKSNGLFKGELGHKLTSVVLRMQNLLLLTGLALLISPEHFDLNLFYVGAFLIVTGIVPVLSDTYRIFFPRKPIQVIEEKTNIAVVNVEKIALWVGLVSGLVALGKEVYMFFSSTGA
jgi:hypothetical protein